MNESMPSGNYSAVRTLSVVSQAQCSVVHFKFLSVAIQCSFLHNNVLGAFHPSVFMHCMFFYILVIHSDSFSRLAQHVDHLNCTFLVFLFKFMIVKWTIGADRSV